MVSKTKRGSGRKGPIGYGEAVKQIYAGEILPVYLLCGEEGYLIELLVRVLQEVWLEGKADVFHVSREDGKSMTQAQAVDLARQMPLFAEKKLVLIDEPAFIPCSGGQAKGAAGSRGAKDARGAAEAEEEAEAEAEADAEAALETGKGEEAADKTEDAGRGENVRAGAAVQGGRRRPAASGELPFTAYLSEPDPGTCLVLMRRSGKPDRRNKLVAQIAAMGGMVEFALLKPKDRMPFLLEAVQKEGKQCHRALLERISRLQGDMASCLLELDKLLTYAGADQQITADMLDNVLAPNPEANIFQMVDALGQRQQAKALGELRALLDSGESPFAIFAMMLRQYRLIFRAKAFLQAGVGRRQIAQVMGAHPYVADKAADQSRLYSFAELENAVELFCRMDLAMKSGAVHQRVLEDLVINLGGSPY